MNKKIFLITWIFLISSLFAYSQNISVKSFEVLPNDQTARVHEPVMDQNGEKCALIKVVTTETGFAWEGGTLGITEVRKKTGEYWVYVPYGSKKITIKHAQLGVLRDYVYPEAINKATVYEMVLTTGKVTTVVAEPEIKSEWVIISSEPDEADVYINDQHKGQTPFQMEMKEGEYTYRINKEMYHPKAGKFVLDAKEGKKRMNVTLEPNFGFAEIQTKPVEGAEILIDGKPTGEKTPFKTDRLKTGEHTVAAQYPMYYDLEKTVTIRDGETSPVVLNLQPAFGSVKISSEPESDAEVLLDGNNTGETTPCELNKITSGEHTITVKKQWYEPTKKIINVQDGKAHDLNVQMRATFGKVTVKTNPEANIFIDNSKVAEGLWSGRLVSGIHTFEAQKEKHQPDKQKFELKVGDNESIDLKPQPKTGTLKIVTKPFDASIYLNDKKYGTTPNTIEDLLVGNYTVKLKKASYGTVTRELVMEEDKTITIEEQLPAGKEVTISSRPRGAEVYVDGELQGKTPQKITLSFGEHQVKMVDREVNRKEKIEVLQAGKSSWKFELYGTFTDKRDGKTYKWVRIGDQVWMVENLNYNQNAYGNDWCYDNNSSNCDTYGRLYNWEAAQRACPDGWHLPSKREFEALLDNVGNDDKQRYLALKKGGNSRFSALFGGFRYADGGFYSLENTGYFWSSSGYSSGNAWHLTVYSSLKTANMSSYYLESVGRSVRCLQD